MSTEQVYLPFDQDWNALERGHYLIQTRINAEGAKMCPLFKLSHGQLLKSSLGPLARYCTHQESVGQTKQKVAFFHRGGGAPPEAVCPPETFARP